MDGKEGRFRKVHRHSRSAIERASQCIAYSLRIAKFVVLLETGCDRVATKNEFRLIFVLFKPGVFEFPRGTRILPERHGELILHSDPTRYNLNAREISAMGSCNYGWCSITPGINTAGREPAAVAAEARFDSAGNFPDPLLSCRRFLAGSFLLPEP